MISFKEWLKTTDYHAFVKDTLGKYVNDILNDEIFPIACEKYIMYKYLITTNDEKQLAMFERLYDEYISFISRRFRDDSNEED